MVLFQEDSEWTTACWEFRSSRVLIGGVLSAGWFSVRYCFFGEFLSLSVPHIFFMSSFLVFTVFYPVFFFIMFLTFFHSFNCHLYIGFNFYPLSPFSLPLFSHFHLSCLSLTFGSDIPLESLCSIFNPLLNPVWGVMPTIRGSYQCITPLHLPSLCLCAVSAQAQKKLVISFFAKISIRSISEMCFFIQHFQTDEFGNPPLLYYPV